VPAAMSNPVPPPIALRPARTVQAVGQEAELAQLPVFSANKGVNHL